MQLKIIQKQLNVGVLGKPLREFMHSDDLGEAVIFALEKWDPNSPNSPRDIKETIKSLECWNWQGN